MRRAGCPGRFAIMRRGSRRCGRLSRGCLRPRGGSPTNSPGPIRQAGWAAASASTLSTATRPASSVCSRSSCRRARQRRCTTYARLDDGRDETKATLKVSSEQTVSAGEFYTLLPPDGDIHYVKTVSEAPSVSIHLLANDTGCVLRHKYDPLAGTITAFRSMWANVKCAEQP